MARRYPVAVCRGEWVDPTLARTRLDAGAERWLEMAAPSLRASTLASYQSLVHSRVVPALGRFRLGDLRPSDVQDFVNDLAADGLSVSRIRKCRIVLALMLDAAVRDGIIGRNVARGARLPRATRREAAYFEPEVVDSIVAALDDPYCLLVRVLGVVGLRYGEAVALERHAVDLLRRRLLVRRSVTEVSGQLVWGTPKSHAERQVPLPPSLAGARAAPELVRRIGCRRTGSSPDRTEASYACRTSTTESGDPCSTASVCPLRASTSCATRRRPA